MSSFYTGIFFRPFPTFIPAVSLFGTMLFKCHSITSINFKLLCSILLTWLSWVTEKQGGWVLLGSDLEKVSLSSRFLWRHKREGSYKQCGLDEKKKKTFIIYVFYLFMYSDGHAWACSIILHLTYKASIWAGKTIYNNCGIYNNGQNIYHYCDMIKYVYEILNIFIQLSQ